MTAYFLLQNTKVIASHKYLRKDSPIVGILVRENRVDTSTSFIIAFRLRMFTIQLIR